MFRIIYRKNDSYVIFYKLFNQGKPVPRTTWHNPSPSKSINQSWYLMCNKMILTTCPVSKLEQIKCIRWFFQTLPQKCVILNVNTVYKEIWYSKRNKSFNCQFSYNSGGNYVEQGVSRASCECSWWKIAWLISMPLFSCDANCNEYSTQTQQGQWKGMPRGSETFLVCVCTRGVNHK